MSRKGTAPRFSATGWSKTAGGDEGVADYIAGGRAYG